MSNNRNCPLPSELKDTESPRLFNDDWICQAPKTLRDVMWFSTFMKKRINAGELDADMKKLSDLLEFSMETIGKCYLLVTGKQVRTEDLKDDPFTVERMLNTFDEAIDTKRKPAGVERVDALSTERSEDEQKPISNVDFGRKRAFTSVKKKRAYSCPSCSRAVRDVRRHLIQAHRWRPENVRSHYDHKTFESGKGKNPKRQCSFEQCTWVGTRFDRHFESQHSLTKKKDPIAYIRMLGLLKPLTRNHAAGKCLISI